LIFKNFSDLFELDNHSLVQFYHRAFAYVLVFYSFFLVVFIYKNKLNELFKPLKIVLLFLFLQAILGVLTLISGLNIYLASFHQITSVLLIFSALNLYYLRAK
jgi:cytochrome c oxidase assembly protein subunit 15